MMTSGATAITGVTCRVTATGWIARSITGLSAVSSARLEASRLATTSAVSAVNSVFQAEDISSGHPSARLAPIADGGGRR